MTFELKPDFESDAAIVVIIEAGDMVFAEHCGQFLGVQGKILMEKLVRFCHVAHHKAGARLTAKVVLNILCGGTNGVQQRQFSGIDDDNSVDFIAQQKHFETLTEVDDLLITDTKYL
jgi:hypothetical protein